ncbi:MAG: hypothetical protein FGM46_10655 [Ferruginibacter sp.]|nr:hypothetical protein [Ferruginibacter sp.]
MKEQNFKNHIRIAPFTYYLGALIGLLAMILALIKIIRNYLNFHAVAITPVLVALIGLALILITYYARTFALKAQDRAIRAEENLRHFAFTGKLLSKELKISQIIALRFASDEELEELAGRAAKEGLTSKQIKQSIIHWRADMYRI